MATKKKTNTKCSVTRVGTCKAVKPKTTVKRSPVKKPAAKTAVKNKSITPEQKEQQYLKGVREIKRYESRGVPFFIMFEPK